MSIALVDASRYGRSVRSPPASESLIAIAACAAGVLSSLPAVAQDNDPAREEWIQLFNGRDLTGWTAKITKHELGDNYANTFRVEDGLLKVRYDGYDAFDQQYGLLFYQTPYSYYRL